MPVQNHAPVNINPRVAARLAQGDPRSSLARKWIFEEEPQQNLVGSPSNESLTSEGRSEGEMSGHNYLHLLALFVACCTFTVTILFTSGALGHRLGKSTALYSC